MRKEYNHMAELASTLGLSVFPVGMSAPGCHGPPMSC